MARILVTGATGFIGFHLTQALLARGDEITCLVRKSSSRARLEPLNVRVVDGDITAPDSLPPAVRGQDVVFQVAGCLRALHVEQLYQINEQGVRNVAAACAAQTTPPVLVQVSSLAAAGPATAGRPRCESDPPAPVSHYGRSKLAGEQAVRYFADRVPTTIVRPPVVFGEADPATSAIYRPIARLGIHVVPSWRETWISLIHADDLVNLLLKAAERGKRLSRDAQQAPAAGEGCYFAAGERDITLAAWGRMIGEALGRRHTCIVRTGAVMVWTIAGIATLLGQLRGRPWYFNEDKAREVTAGSWTCAAEAAARELGFTVEAPLASRIAQTVRWYRENGWL